MTLKDSWAILHDLLEWNRIFNQKVILTQIIGDEIRIIIFHIVAILILRRVDRRFLFVVAGCGVHRAADPFYAAIVSGSGRQSDSDANQDQCN